MGLSFFSQWVLCFAMCFHAVTARQLRAIANPPFLKTRSLGLKPSHGNCDLLYVDDTSLSSGSPFAASLSFSPKLPTLVLDDADAHFSHIDCFESAIEMHFVSMEQVQAARSAWEDSSIFLVVTSHTACVSDQSHRPYVVKSVTFAPDRYKATLYVEEASFRSAADSIHLEFGNSIHKRYLGKRIEARDTSALVTSTIPPKAAYPSATGSPTAQSISTAFRAAYTDAAILPPDSAIANQLTNLLPVPSGILLSCANCTIVGSMELVEGSISSQKNGNEFENLDDFKNSGYVTFTVNGMDARIGLELSLQKGFASQQFNAQLPPIGIPGLSIPGIGAIGPQLLLGIFMGVQIDTAINFTTGLELSVPSGSSMTFNISQISSSTVTGFDSTTFNSLPFQMKSSPPKLTFFAGFLPQLLLGFSAFGNDISGGVGAFMNLPKLQVSIAEVSGVDQNCIPTQTSPLPGVQFLIKENAIVNIGVEENLNFTSKFIPNEQASKVLGFGSVNLGSQCLMFDEKSSSLVTAHSPTPTPSTSASGSGSGSGAGSPTAQSDNGNAAPTLKGSRMAVTVLLLAWISGWMVCFL